MDKPPFSGSHGPSIINDNTVEEIALSFFMSYEYDIRMRTIDPEKAAERSWEAAVAFAKAKKNNENS